VLSNWGGGGEREAAKKKGDWEKKGMDSFVQIHGLDWNISVVERGCPRGEEGHALHPKRETNLVLPSESWGGVGYFNPAARQEL